MTTLSNLRNDFVFLAHLRRISAISVPYLIFSRSRTVRQSLSTLSSYQTGVNWTNWTTCGDAGTHFASANPEARYACSKSSSTKIPRVKFCVRDDEVFFRSKIVSFANSVVCHFPLHYDRLARNNHGVYGTGRQLVSAVAVTLKDFHITRPCGDNKK